MGKFQIIEADMIKRLLRFLGWIDRKPGAMRIPWAGIEPNTVHYPFRATLEAMRTKDPELFERVGSLSPSVAIRLWREKYPEDFAS